MTDNVNTGAAAVPEGPTGASAPAEPRPAAGGARPDATGPIESAPERAVPEQAVPEQVAVVAPPVAGGATASGATAPGAPADVPAGARAQPAEPTTRLPPYSMADQGADYGANQPTERIPVVPVRDPYPTAVQPFPPIGDQPHGAAAMPTSDFPPRPPAAQSRRPGLAGLLAGAVVLALLSGAIGGVIGAVATRHHDNSVATTAVTSTNTAPMGSVTAVAQRVLPSVVMIKVSGNQREGEGSGEILTPDGYILTNNHVAAGGGAEGKMTVVFSDGSIAPATLVGADATYDIAVIKVTGKSGLTPIQIGTSKTLQVGQQVVAIGSPLGLADTVTTGIVSALNRPVATSGESGDQGSVIDAIQTDAAINPGNSGGALVDMDGKLIGINTAIASLGSAGPDQQSGSIGLGFAIPVDQAMRIAHQLMTNGHAVHPVIGIVVRSVDSGAGAQVQSVVPTSPAGKAGIPVGAIVTKLDNRLIDSSDALVAAVRSYQPGDKVFVTYTDPQSGVSKTVQVTLSGQSDSGAR
jgi:putative serine protease PepD